MTEEEFDSIEIGDRVSAFYNMSPIYPEWMKINHVLTVIGIDGDFLEIKESNDGHGWWSYTIFDKIKTCPEYLKKQL